MLQGDYNLLMGTISLSIIAVATATMVIDLIYPLARPAHPAPLMALVRQRAVPPLPRAAARRRSSWCSAASCRWLAPDDPLAWYTAPRNQPPSWTHLLGTTSLGQDIFWLLALALRNSLILGVIVSASSRP